MKIFEITEEQYNKYKEWAKELTPYYSGAAGGAMTWEFSPSGLGVVVKVYYWRGHVTRHQEVDLTDYESW